MRIFWMTFAPLLPSDVLAGGALAGALLLLLLLLRCLAAAAAAAAIGAITANDMTTPHELGDRRRWNASIPPPPPEGTPPEPPLDSRPLKGHDIPESWKQVNISQFLAF